MKKIVLFISISCFAALHLQAQLPRLKVSDNRRFLVTEEGRPFFWMADTAWELFHRCNAPDAEMYFDTRARQGFNVVQAVALAELDGLNTPNANGDTPIENIETMAMNEKYFLYMDKLINMAADKGIYIALLPTWGDKVFKSTWGEGPEIFNKTNAFTYGKWLGNRYKNQTNIVWVIGGDRRPREDSDDLEIWRSMARGITEGVGGAGNALMTFHPQPAETGGSSNWFHNDAWLDFNMHQTGHCPSGTPYLKLWYDYDLTPIKPTLDGEPLYEDHPNCFKPKELGHSVHEDIRRMLYWNVFAGGLGQTYGCHAVWQMYDQDKKPINIPLRPWKMALELPMANQVKHLKNLMLSRPFLSRIPDREMITDIQTNDENFVIATRDSHGDYAMVYFPTGKAVTVDLGQLNGPQLTLTWYDPRTGVSFSGGEGSSKKMLRITPPSAGKGQDWVLVIDNAKKHFPKPGTTTL